MTGVVCAGYTLGIYVVAMSGCRSYDILGYIQSLINTLYKGELDMYLTLFIITVCAGAVMLLPDTDRLGTNDDGSVKLMWIELYIYVVAIIVFAYLLIPWK